MTTGKELFQKIGEQVLEAMARDNLAPWQRPWLVSGEMPHNGVSKKAYRGANVLILVLAGMGHTSAKWVTFAQAKALGGCVRKGEKGTHIIFWKPLKKIDKKTGVEKKSVMAREYVVFNVDQCDGLEFPVVELPVKTDEINAQAEALIAAAPCAISYGGDRAYYRPSTDAIQIPSREFFKGHAEFYTVAFHEMGHATGHATRLNRDGISLFDGFGSHQYSREELVAEFTACFLAGQCGFDRTTLDNSAAYLKCWAAKIKDEPGIIAEALQAAQKAADSLLAAAEAEEEEEEEIAA
jgi:antirestriction protein ArdC